MAPPGLTGLADHGQDRADRECRAFAGAMMEQRTGGRRRYLDNRLCGLHLYQDLVHRHGVAHGHVPANNVRLGEALTYIREFEYVSHRTP